VRRLAREESGWALVTTVVLTAVMVTMGLAVFTYVDGQTSSSARERLNESGFNLAEGALNQQMYVLSHAWPGADPGASPSAPAYPPSCGPASATPLCPDSTALRQSYNSVDYGGAPAWTTEVHDNDTGDTPDFYDDADPSPARWDSNRDRRMWVRAQATVKGRTRAIVGLVQVETRLEEMPRSALIAGAVATTNLGNKDIICTRLPDKPDGLSCQPSSSPLAGPVQVRCVGTLGSLCVDVRMGQIEPDPVQTGYTGGDALAADAIERLRARAVMDGTYYATGCPANPSGEVVFVQSGHCSYDNSVPGACCNSPTRPGVFIVANGSFSLNGNLTYHGVVYALNRQGAVACVPGCPVAVGGTAMVRGGVHVDGQGGFLAGSSKVNVVYDDFPYNRVRSYGAVTLVQNRWREIVARPGA
jgi:hypothetical protein